MLTRTPALVLLAILASCAPPAGARSPKLVVMIGIDQFGAEYLLRMDPMLERGFRRLQEEGRSYREALVDHAPTLSLPGHTTLATGAYPKTHGIVANDWSERQEDGTYARIVAVLDRDQEIVGKPGSPGVSPKRIRVTGLADWIRAADPNARTAAVSTGPFLAMLYGGRAERDRSRNHVYWLSRSSWSYETSTFYRDEYPEWLERFNKTVMTDARKSLVWESTVPRKHRDLARRDEAFYEADKVHVTFPHRPSDRSADLTPAAEARWYYDSPLADESLFALARHAVESLNLGGRESTDFLAVAVKSVDRVGHDFGPRSQEQLDVIHRLDILLGDFLDFLDDRLGEGRYLIALSADHGAPNVTEYEVEEGRASMRISEEEIAEALGRVKRLVDGYDGPPERLPGFIAAELEKSDFVARAMTPEDLSGTGPADEIVRLYRNSFDPTRPNLYPLWTTDILQGSVEPSHPANFGVMVEIPPQANIYTAASTHGSAYDYDRQVPILIMGPGVRPGPATGPARTMDVAPTLARLAGIPYPDTVDGRVLED